MCQGREAFTKAVCSCNASFPDCDLRDAVKHITGHSNPNHTWVWLHKDWEFLLTTYPKPARYIEGNYE